ncbi:hypothetical protein [Amphritea sp. HPY]|uniref:hypothetical protein n=1 Tax=Amphritea sp. HPY TaxID=3421652 RepID=UPI003D7CE3A6
MKKLLLILSVALFTSLPVAAQDQSTQGFSSIPAQADTKCQWINGYYRKDGTFVSGHYRGC